MPTLRGNWADTLTFAQCSKSSSLNNSHILNLPQVHPVPNTSDFNQLTPKDIWSAFFCLDHAVFSAAVTKCNTYGFLGMQLDRHRSSYLAANPHASAPLSGLNVSSYMKNKKPHGTQAKFHFPSHLPASRRKVFLLQAF